MTVEEIRKVQRDTKRIQYQTDPGYRIKILSRNLKRRQTYPDYYRAKNKEYWERRRAECIQAYGGKCACCGETIDRFLTIDHVDGNGSKHRASVGNSIYTWLIKNGFPKGFQVLCFNCNCGRYHNGGVCPHVVMGRF